MKTLSTRKGGFTLIELMIVVAIIGILAAIAIPNFLRFQLRARSSEGKTNLAAIRTAEEGYFSEFNVYVAGTPTPGAAPVGGQKVPWPVPANGCPGIACFDTVGWSPEGDVFFTYEAAIGVGEFMAVATADIDNDGTVQNWTYVKPLPGAAAYGGAGTAIDGGACATSGSYNSQTAAPDLLTTVGPCTATDGQSVF
jgi:type IV pilus assembly protein PilA